MAVDPFKNSVTGLSAPAQSAVAVVPSDTTDLAFTTRAVYVGSGGHLSVRMAGQTTAIVFRNLPISLLPIRVDRILATGTTATDIIALW
jgi:hypothetical protein